MGPEIWAQDNVSAGTRSKTAIDSTMPEYPTYNRIGKTPWYHAPGVQEELKLNDEQYKQLSDSYGKAWTQYNQGVTDLDRNLTDEEKVQRRQALSRNFQKEVNKSADTVLIDPALRARYDQLYLQHQGYSAFNDPDVQARLKLTAAQRSKFMEGDRAWNRDMHSWRRDYDRDPTLLGEHFGITQDRYHATVEELLDDDQIATWKSMTGERYKWTPSAYYGK